MDEHDRDEQHVAIITPTEIFSLQGSNLLGSLLAEQKRKKKFKSCEPALPCCYH